MEKREPRNPVWLTRDPAPVLVLGKGNSIQCPRHFSGQNNTDETKKEYVTQHPQPVEELVPTLEARLKVEQDQFVPLVQPLHPPRNKRVEQVPQHRQRALPLLLRRSQLPQSKRELVRREKVQHLPQPPASVDLRKNNPLQPLRPPRKEQVVRLLPLNTRPL